jgi:peroxiredoxin family protein
MSDIAIETSVDVKILTERVTALEDRLAEVEESLPKNRVTIVVFSGELDRVLAAFIIATGALAMGAVDMGATMYNCTMSQDVMGIDKQELREDAQDAGAATFIADGLESKITLFI